MRSGSLHYPCDCIRLSVITRKSRLVLAGGAWRYAYIERSKDAEDDTGTGSADQDAGADFRTYVPHGQLVEVAAHRSGRPDDLAGLRHGPRIHGPLVLRSAVPLSDAVTRRASAANACRARAPWA